MNKFNNDGSFMDQFRRMQETMKNSPASPKSKPVQSDPKKLDKPPANSIKERSSRFSGPALSTSTSNTCDNRGHSLVTGSASLGGAGARGENYAGVRWSTPQSSSSEVASVFREDDDDEEIELDPKTKDAIENLARAVAIAGKVAEDAARKNHKKNPAYWFLYDTNCAGYARYVVAVKQQKEANSNNPPTPERPNDLQRQQPGSSGHSAPNSRESTPSNSASGQRKRGSRWSEQPDSAPKRAAILPTVNLNPTNLRAVAPPPQMNIPPPGLIMPRQPTVVAYPMVKPAPRMHTSIDGFSAPQPDFIAGELQQPPVNSSALAAEHLTEGDPKKKAALAKLIAASLERDAIEMGLAKPRRAYDSDEELEEDGTWEHRKRKKEMEKTKDWAAKLTEENRGKKHLINYLPPEALAKSLSTSQRVSTSDGSGSAETESAPTSSNNTSDYAENKLTQTNLGYKMLQKMGWSEGKGLGAENQGIQDPVNKGRSAEEKTGLGLISESEPTQDDDVFDQFRKRMMLAYKYRPNPLNNPRRPYY